MIIPGNIIREDISRRDDHPAIITPESELSYKQLSERINHDSLPG